MFSGMKNLFKPKKKLEKRERKDRAAIDRVRGKK